MRRGDPEHTYARLVRELRAGAGREREQYIRLELDKLWWGLNEEQRARVPELGSVLARPEAEPAAKAPDQVTKAEVLLGEAERAALAADPKYSASTEEARREWEAEVDARIAAASKERYDG